MWTLVVMSHGRWPYLGRALESLDLDFFDHRVAAFDGCEPPKQIADVFHRTYSTANRQGLTVNLGNAWGMLGGDDEWVVHLEEDFVLLDKPWEAMASVLSENRHVANMVLQRQPWNAAEDAAGSVLATVPGLVEHVDWCEHSAGFWLNPMVAHASLLRSLRPGVEVELTRQCVGRGYSFGYFGGRDDGPRCLHIGAVGGMGSLGWKP